MENRQTGFIVIGLSAGMGIIIFLFNQALIAIVNTSCSHGPSCPMWQSIKYQTNISIGLMVFVILIGLYLVFSEQLDRVLFKPKKEKKKITKKSFKTDMSKLSANEKTVFEKIIESQGALFQSELVEKSGFNKVKVTRILDKLEGKDLIDRKRRGMSNIVILKH